ncbi:hypothetical protein MLD38_029992 [Melastoma candidum]|uniref:Uncharacterized protein n=1 Tax=Melastoma candidum TaxID=119954 RepID=A0ACB9MK00_9MYRT|nr:hypothetical protein MLD38_029992 [Melastoma candidum]
MADAPSVLSFLLMLLLLLLLFPAFVLSRDAAEFVFHGFNSTTLALDGASVVKPSSALKLTNVSDDYIGHAFYPDPVQMFPTGSKSSSNAFSFSTQFVFVIRPSSPHGQGGYGLAFVVSPSNKFPSAEAEHYLGLFNSSNDNDPNNHMFVVEFDTMNGYNSSEDYKGSHVGINVNGMRSIAAQPAGYYKDGEANNKEIPLESGQAIQAWIDYDGESQLVNVTIAPIKEAKPVRPLLSANVNLTDILLEDMYVGFSAATGKTTSFHYVLGWSFKVNGTAPPLNLTLLPLPPNDQESSSYKPQIIVVIAVLSTVAFLLIAVLVITVMVRRRRRLENLEEWELDCPRRFQYKDLHEATRGFSKTKLIGNGGFGSVYQGILPSNGCEVAVKKISRNSIQGMREFVAEIESLGRLRHRNLVHLQGWCKRKDDLLLVYDYIPYGSLDSLLFKRKDGFVLGWDQRLHIIKGITAGLLYLHEEWEKVVIHRDVKSSNVLIDAEMNARLGDFGLARLYEPGATSHTTNIMGTVGYIAPELVRSGKSSASTDVYAFGVMLLEVAAGRRPVGSGNFLLVEWVVECHRSGDILRAADPRLKSEYNTEEMELVLKLGLLCTHDNAQVRPSMRQAMRYLNRDETLPVVADWRLSDSSRSTEMSMKFLEIISTDTFTGSQESYYSTSRPFSSFGPGR